MENRRPYWQVAVSLVFSIFATAAFIVIGIKAIGFFMPFVVGWVISSIAAPLVEFLEKRLKIVKKLGSALIVILVIGVIVLAFYFAVSRIVAEVGDLIKNIPELYNQLETGLRQIGGSMSGLLGRLPGGVQEGLNAMVENLDQYMGTVISGISEPTVAAAGNLAKRLPSFLISVLVAIISAYFFTVEKEEVLAWTKKIAPPSVERRMTLVMDNLRYAVGGYFKAQFKIMGVVLLIMIIGLALLGVRYYVLVAILISVLDFLPFFGTGTALFPWALYKFLMGDFKTAAVLLIIYVVSQLGRQVLQPKLVGDSIGMSPLVTLLFLYIGYRVSSVLGMILAVPVGLVMINMYRAGAFDYILDDIKILVEGILKLRENPEEGTQNQK